MNKKVSIPLVAPGFNRLRADAVWVTIANWADGFEDEYGKAEVLAGDSSYTADQIRARCFTANNDKISTKKPNRFRYTYLGKVLEMLAKDIRWYFEEKKKLSIDVERFKNAPFVWQHHDLFQTRGLKLAKSLGVPSVLFVDAPYVWESKKWGVHRFGWEWFAESRGDATPFKKADLILVVSEDVKRAVMNLGIEESRILITPCTVSHKMFDQVNRSEVRKSLELENKFVIGWVGSFRKFHSLDLLVKAFKDISSILPKARLLLVGDGPERLRLREMVETYSLGEKVIFTGNVPHNEIHSYISCFDLAVLPSKLNDDFHYSPLKLREFFAAGVPVVASAVGDVKIVIDESDGGWLVSPGSKDSIAKMILKLEKDQTAIKFAGSKARSYSLKEMGIFKQIRMIESYFGITTSK